MSNIPTQAEIINYIKLHFPKVVFNQLNLLKSDTNSIGFVISSGKAIIGTIDKNGSLCKLTEPIDLTKQDVSFKEIIKQIPVVEGFDQKTKDSLLGMFSNNDIPIVDNTQVLQDLQSQLNKKQSEYTVLVENVNEQNAKIADFVLIKTKYENRIQEITDNFKKYKSDTENCSKQILNEKETIINAIIGFKKGIVKYIQSQKDLNQQNVQKILAQNSNSQNQINQLTDQLLQL